MLWSLISVQTSFLIGVWKPSEAKYWSLLTAAYSTTRQRSKYNENWAAGSELYVNLEEKQTHFVLRGFRKFENMSLKSFLITRRLNNFEA